MSPNLNTASLESRSGQTTTEDPVPKLISYGTINGVTTNKIPGKTTQDEELSLSSQGRGVAAWIFLAGCFWLEALIWGFPYSYSVFERYYSNHTLFSSERGIAAVGTTCMGLAYFGSPAATAVLQRWPSQRRRVSIIGLLMIVAALVLASFSTHVLHLIFTQGLLYGVGGALLYNPFVIYVEEWFEKQKGLAYGIFWAGTGFSGAVMPFLMDWALERYGFRTTLRAWAVVAVCTTPIYYYTGIICRFITLGFLVYFLRPPRPLPDHKVTVGKNFNFLRSPLFWAFQFGNVIEGLGYFVPQVFLTSFAKSVGLSNQVGIISISLLNMFSTAGLILMGLLVDRYHISTVLLISAVLSTLSVFLLWGFALNEITLYIFSITFGIFAGGYVATWTGCSLEVQKSTPGSDVAVINGFMAAGRGLGCVFGGPVSEALLSLRTLEAKGAYGTRFGILIIFTGITSFMGRFGLFGRWGLQAGETEIKDAHDASEERESLVR